MKILYRYRFTLEPEAPTTAVFEGVVRARTSQKPLAGVTVQIAGSLHALTDGAGRFRVEAVPPGTRTITLEGEKLTALGTRRRPLRPASSSTPPTRLRSRRPRPRPTRQARTTWKSW